jgi:hypothetical protein
MTIAYACDCGERFTVSDEQSGHDAFCPVCRREHVVTVRRITEPIKAPQSSTEFEEERLDPEKAIKVRRPTWKRPAVIASIATPVIIQSPQPLPGVPPPVGALSQPSGSQSNIQSPPKGEPD